MNGRDSTNGSLSIIRGAIYTQQYAYNIVWEGMDESMNGMEWITTSNKYSTYSNDSLSINTHISTYKYKYSIDDSFIQL